MIPLTVRSYYSLMWGTSSPEEICAAAKQRGYNRLALTDTDNLYGLWPFLKACEHMGITPIVGAELTDCASKLRAVCLVENDEGYRNLCRLVTRRHSDDLFDLKSAIIDHSKGLVVLTQSREFISDWYEAGVTIAAAIPRKPDSAGFRLRKTARHLGISMVATPGSFFLNPDDIEIHRMLRAIDLNTSLSRLTAKDTASPSAWLAPASVYAGRFDIWPNAVTDTEEIAERLTFTGPSNGLVLPPWDDKKKHTAGEFLRNAAYKGARRRYGNDLSETVVDRLEHELGIIEKMKFSSYFLVVQDIFLSDTAKLADVVLPSAAFAEKEGTFTNTERKIQRVRKAIQPPGKARQDWKIIGDLSTRMGYPMAYRNSQEIMKEIARVTPSYGGITYSRLEKEDIPWPCPTLEHPGTPRLHVERFTRGMGMFHPIEYLPPAELPDKEYPLYLTTGRVLYQFHTGTMTMQSAGLNDLAPECFVEISSKDAQDCGVGEGDFLRVRSRRGEIRAKAQISDEAIRGTVFIPFHFAEAAANRLTIAALDPIAKIPEFKVCAVRIEKAQ